MFLQIFLEVFFFLGYEYFFFPLGNSFFTCLLWSMREGGMSLELQIVNVESWLFIFCDIVITLEIVWLGANFLAFAHVGGSYT